MNNPNQQLIDGLRGVADFLEVRPEMPAKSADERIMIFVSDPEAWHRAIRAMGTATKEPLGDLFGVRRQFGAMVSLAVYQDRAKVCQRVKIGEKVIAAQPERVIPEQIVPAVPEQVVDQYEWVCPESILQPADEAAALCYRIADAMLVERAKEQPE